MIWHYFDGSSWSRIAYLNPAGKNFGSASDRRAKRDIQAVTSGTLEQIQSLKPSSYVYRSAPEGTPAQYGFIAQDVQEVFPEIVEDQGEELSLYYKNFHAIAIAGIQELDRREEEREAATQARITELEAENRELRGQIDAILARLERLESQGAE